MPPLEPVTSRPATPPQLETLANKDSIRHPGDVKINVEGAFIVDSDASHSPRLDPLDDYEHDGNDIRLPNHTAVVSHIAVDIGGSLAKLVYFSREPESRDLGGRLNFLKFETDRIHECIAFMHKLQQRHQRINGQRQDLCVMATGGGAFKYYDDIKKALGVEVLREDEMECLIVGLDFFISEIPSEVFTHSADAPMTYLPPRSAIYPYLLVNIGSGVSMIKVSGPREFKRIGGTSLGGGTLWGLLSLITGARSFDDMLAMADKGDNTAVDMLVGDIYGTGDSLSKHGLKADTIASSFGKVYKMKRQAETEAEDGSHLSNGTAGTASDEIEENATLRNPFKPEDVSRSLLYAVSYNIGQIAYLQSCKHDLEHIYFGGSFIRGHRQTMNTLSYAIRFWSNNEKQAYFLRHEGYLGSVGAFLKRQPRNWGRKNSFDSGIPSAFRRRAGDGAENGVDELPVESDDR
ncbi:hypothetical protein FH972_021754 [Carpinus fangiana]|uniref:Pantothenate kinase n=1 Tax=Carpinus fangiana TaxID=176857 RepID=A0A5N6KQL2_9ROSI|nr:hypothetical protein FH972_021754 [Carpinus fangiana]